VGAPGRYEGTRSHGLPDLNSLILGHATRRDTEGFRLARPLAIRSRSSGDHMKPCSESRRILPLVAAAKMSKGELLVRDTNVPSLTKSSAVQREPTPSTIHRRMSQRSRSSISQEAPAHRRLHRYQHRREHLPLRPIKTSAEGARTAEYTFARQTITDRFGLLHLSGCPFIVKLCCPSTNGQQPK